jgi:hypothetical protein
LLGDYAGFADATLREQIDGTDVRKCRSSTGDDHEKGEKDGSANSV